jgi:predicted outer membrane repeat protein
MKHVLKNRVALFLTLLAGVLFAEVPQWWIERGVIDTNTPPSDYAPVNQGQAKHFAYQAYLEFSQKLTNDCSAISNLVASFSATNNYLSVNLGQLKYLATPFYDLLWTNNYTVAWPEGMTGGPYPWSDSTDSAQDYAIANIGQLKYLFSFDLAIYTDPVQEDPVADPIADPVAIEMPEDSDGDGYLNIYENLRGSDPNNPASIPAANIYVSTNGSHTSPYSNTVMAATNIQTALNHSTNDSYSIIEIADGVYSGTNNVNLIIRNVPVMLRSTNGPGGCVIDCLSRNNTRGISFVANTNKLQTFVQGITIRNGKFNGAGGGINCVGATPVIRNCVISNCTVTTVGGGLYASAATGMILDQCVFSGNTANTGGGGVYVSNSPSLSIRDSRIITNKCMATASLGGGIHFASSANASVSNTTIAGNTAGASGGGVYATFSTNMVLTQCPVVGNTAGSGGGIYVNSSPLLTIRDSQISTNKCNLPTSLGGGLYVQAASGTIIDQCVFSGNIASNSGGGMYVTLSTNMSLTGSFVVSNTASAGGGGIYVNSSPSLTIRDSWISTNKCTAAASLGGGIHFASSANASVSNTLIAGNSAVQGAGVYLISSTNVSLHISPVLNNVATGNNGGGIYANGTLAAPSSLKVVNTEIISNRCVSNGGGVSLNYSPNSRFEECKIFDNDRAKFGGAASVLLSTNTLFQNCVMMGNSSTNSGGAVWISSSDKSKIINCTLINNRTGAGGGGGIYQKDKTLYVTNAILWANTPQQVLRVAGTGSFSINYSCIQNGTNGIVGVLGGNNITNNPAIVSHDYHLIATSPCINRATNGPAIVDIDGEARTNRCDIGADEWLDTDNDEIPDWYELKITTNATALVSTNHNDADSLDNLEEYKEGLLANDGDYDDDGLLDGDELYDETHGDTDGYVTNPFYRDTDGDKMHDGYESRHDLNPTDADDKLQDPDGDGYLNIYECLRGESDPREPASIPEANIYVSTNGIHEPPYDTWETAATNIQTALNYSTNKPYSIIELAAGEYKGTNNVNLIIRNVPVMLRSTNGPGGCVIDCQSSNNTRGISFAANTNKLQTFVQGITIRNGKITGTGGGINCTNATPVIRNCVISNCTATTGGGLYASAAPGMILDQCVFSGNTANTGGGGIYAIKSPELTLSNSQIYSNRCTTLSTSYGGGIQLVSSTNTSFKNSTFVNNSSAYAGGAVSVLSSTNTLFENCVMMGNSSTNRGGAVWVSLSDKSKIINCTLITNRTGTVGGGGIYQNNNTLYVTNTILWANTPQQVLRVAGAGTFSINYSCIQNGTNGIAGVSGGNNISNNPVFDSDGWHLTSASPCVDAGINAGVPPIDIEGEARMDITGMVNRVSSDDFADIGADEFFDSDGDGYSDVQELYMHTDPNNGDIFPVIVWIISPAANERRVVIP